MISQYHDIMWPYHATSQHQIILPDGIPSFCITASDHIARWAFHHFISQHQIILPDGHSIISYHSIRSVSDEQSIFSHRLRLTLGDMFENEVPQNNEIGPERGPRGSVWAETLSK